MPYPEKDFSRDNATRTALVGAALGLSAALSCSGSSEPPAPARPELIEISVTPSTADTIASPITRAIVATVTDSQGRPVPDTLVNVSASLAGSVPAIGLSATAGGPQPTQPLKIRTNSAGGVTVYGQLKDSAGVYHIYFVVDGTNVTDSIPITILPGNPQDMLVTPADTAVFVGAQYPLGVQVKDRRGNVISGGYTVETLRPDVASYSAPNVVAVGTGRGMLRVTAGTVVRERPISVVPQGTLAAILPTAVAVMQLDGTGRTTHAGGGLGLRWAPSGDRVAFYTAGRIYSMPLPGSASRMTPVSISILDELQPQYSRDGMWVYFSASPADDMYEIWRIKPDGTLAARVGPAADIGNLDTSPSPSPTGDRVVFATNRVSESVLVLQIVAVNGGALTPINVPGHHPRWAPIGEQIAFIDGNKVGIVNSDGSNKRFVGTSTFDEFHGGVDWSPDAQWLIACAHGTFSGDRRLLLIRVSNGEEVPLPYSGGTVPCVAAWRP